MALTIGFKTDHLSLALAVSLRYRFDPTIWTLVVAIIVAITGLALAALATSLTGLDLQAAHILALPPVLAGTWLAIVAAIVEYRKEDESWKNQRGFSAA